jgi:hypothetical protein
MSTSNKQHLHIILDDWTHLNQMPHDFLENFVFRGQENSQWELATKLQRAYQDISSMVAKERELIHSFESLYPTSLPLTKNQAFLEFILNNHNYARPMRILDFSKSFFVALWFAMNGEAKESSIYAVNKIDIIYDSLRKADNDNPSSSFAIEHLEKLNRELIFPLIKNNFTERGLYYIEPLSPYKKLKSQQTVHLFQKRIGDSFEDNLREQNSTKEVISSSEVNQNITNYSLVKIVIPIKFRGKIHQLLRNLNITKYSLSINN